MKMPQSAKYALGVAAAVALLAGCSGGSGSQIAPTGAAQSSAIKLPAAQAKLAQSTSVLSPRAAKPQMHQLKKSHAIPNGCCAYAKTTFISDPYGGTYYTSAVKMFDYKTNEYLGNLPSPPEGFSETQGMCTDKGGNVWVSNTGESTLDQYTHSGTFIRSLSDPGQYPVGCSVDSSTGNLAVSNIISTSGGPGSISVYSNASGSPTNYAVPTMQRVYFLAYMGKTGTLYLDGVDPSYEFEYASLSGGSVTPITVSGASIGFPGTVAYSGKTGSMNVGDQDGAVLYQVSSTGQVTGSTPLSGSYAVVQGTIKGPNFVAPDAGAGDVKIYAYPAGGSPTSTITGYFLEPIGSAVSADKPQ